MEVFELPLLRNLYVYSNRLVQLEEDLAFLEKPIKAPLQSLNIADCRLTSIPDFGVLPGEYFTGSGCFQCLYLPIFLHRAVASKHLLEPIN